MPALTKLSIQEIEMDKTNPRIQRALSMYGDEITAERIALALKEGSGDEDGGSTTTFNRLKNSIKKNKGIINPIVVNKKQNEYVCIEGNTRLLIYRDFYEGRDKADDEQWLYIPCLVHEDADEEEIDAIRLQAHLIGPRQWDPYSKAKYLHYLWNVEYLSADQIIEYCGGNRRQIEDSITAYNMVEEVYKPLLKSEEDFDHTRFSGFVEYQDPKVQEAVLDAGFDTKDFSLWLHKRKIKRLDHVRLLPKIMQNKEAKEAFLQEGSDAADRILKQPSLEELIKKLDIKEFLEAVQHKIDTLPYGEIERYKKDPDVLEVAEETIKKLGDFKESISSS
ncbi:MAG: ParB N-terminal domain-containing protein [Hyphomicrobiales bacterium]|nr:ParB N-terminal domain-containing protein [Hyphomicrobiales bacterium]